MNVELGKKKPVTHEVRANQGLVEKGWYTIKSDRFLFEKKKKKKRNGGYLDGSVAVGRIERSAEEGGAAGSAGSSGRRRRRLDAFGPAAFGSAALLRQPPPHNRQEKKHFQSRKKIEETATSLQHSQCKEKLR